MARWQIVVVEDNSADILLVQMALEQNDVPCVLTAFNNGEEAVKALCPVKEDSPDGPLLDAILLDLNTPKSDRFEVLRQLMQTPRFAQIPIAILTFSQATIDKSRAARLGVRYIEKPSHLEAFLSTVGKAVREMLGQPAAERPLEARS
jgi:CheY-like chemotaxis protein